MECRVVDSGLIAYASNLLPLAPCYSFCTLLLILHLTTSTLLAYSRPSILPAHSLYQQSQVNVLPQINPNATLESPWWSIGVL
jgi:hypothetical protein